jgi:hypothetical protein
MLPLQPWSLTRTVIAFLVAPAIGCDSETPTADQTEPGAPTLEQARAELRGYIENVTQATARRYHATDNQGNVLDGVKIIPMPPPADSSGSTTRTMARSSTSISPRRPIS